MLKMEVSMNKKERLEEKIKKLEQRLDNSSILSKENAQHFMINVPNNSDYFNSLSPEEQEKYFSLNNLYRVLLNEYVSLFLGKYDKELTDSDLGFKTVPLEKQDFYQYYSNGVFNYYYVRNNIYHERLSDTDLDYLQRRAVNGDFSLTNEDMQFIARTFSGVIEEQTSSSNIDYDINYGPMSSSFIASNKALVVGFRYDQFCLDGIDREQWALTNNNQRSFLWDFNTKLQSELCESLPGTVKLIEYDDYSVKPLGISQQNRKRGKL